MSRRWVDLAGHRYGSITVLERAEHYVSPSGIRLSRWWCRCDCGTVWMVIHSALRSGKTKSCGCQPRKPPKRGGLTVDAEGHRTPTYMSWMAMKARCLRSSSNGYENYGGRGIKIDPRWDSFKNFLEDMGERPEGTILGRIDLDGDYTLDNCRWSSRSEQNRNKKSRKGLVGVDEDAE